MRLYKVSSETTASLPLISLDALAHVPDCTPDPRTVHGVLHRMRQRGLSMAWVRWRVGSSVISQQRRLVLGALTRLITRQLGAAFNMWREAMLIIIIVLQRIIIMYSL